MKKLMKNDIVKEYAAPVSEVISVRIRHRICQTSGETETVTETDSEW